MQHLVKLNLFLNNGIIHLCVLDGHLKCNLRGVVLQVIRIISFLM